MLLLLAFAAAPPADGSALAADAMAVLRRHCYRCHGQDGSVEGGLNYVLDRDTLVARKKLTALLSRTERGRMPPPDVKPRPTPDEVATLRRWIDAGAPPERPAARRWLVTETQVMEGVLADMDRFDRRARRFLRYFSLVPLYNGGAGDDELRTYSNAVSKLLNSLSWHPKARIPESIAGGLVLRIDLRDYLWDAALWNRLLADYPYGVVVESGVSRAVLVNAATRMPVVRADWFVATASRAPLYYDLLQIPASLGELERQLRVDSALNIQQERVARVGFNGSGISRSNRVLERHDAMNGAYWRSYDFDAVPQNLLDRNLLLPDRRNLFAFPLGPNLGDAGFLHAGGEVIFNLPNGLQAYMLVNANGVRINKGPQDIVSDAKRPDRAVEAGLSCMHCHATGILVKDDQIRDHVHKNRKAFTRKDIDAVEALYAPAKKMRELMEDDARRHQAAVARTGNKTSGAEVVLSMTLRHEADVDLRSLAAELGVTPEEVTPALTATENLSRNLGALKVDGGTVSRQVVVQAFADLVRELRLGAPFDPGRGGEALPDATGDADPLETLGAPANAAAFRPDGRFAALASSDRTVRILDVSTGRDVRRLIGHTASVWAVAYSPDGSRVLSGSKDGSVRLWNPETGREIAKFDGHADLVSAVAFSPDGKRALSAGYDGEVILWDLERAAAVTGFNPPAGVRYPHAVAFSADGMALVTSAERVIVFDPAGKRPKREITRHRGWVNAAAFTPKGVLTASDDGTARLWDPATGEERDRAGVLAFPEPGESFAGGLITMTRLGGHNGPMTAAALRGGGEILTGGADAAVRLYGGPKPRVFAHASAISGVAFSPGGRSVMSVSRDGKLEVWAVVTALVTPPEARPAPATGVKALSKTASTSIDGTVGGLLLDGRWLYVHDRSGRLLKLDTETLRRDKALALDAETVIYDRRSLLLLALTPGWLHTIDPETLTVKGKQAVPRGYDVAAHDGRVVVSQDADEWTDIIELGSKRTFGPVWRRSFVALADGKVCASTHGVVPGSFEVFDGTTVAKAAVGGEFGLTLDGRYALMRSGAVVRVEGAAIVAKVEPHVASSLSENSAWVLTRDGSLIEYDVPAWKAVGRWRVAGAAYRLAVDESARRAYVASFDPGSVVDRPRAKGHADITVYELPAVRR